MEALRTGQIPQTPSQAAPAFTELPPNSKIILALDDHVRSDSAIIGAAVNAHLVSDLRSAGTILAPKGTPVHGVVRQYVKANDGLTFSFTLTIEFNELVLPARSIPFRARLMSIDTPVKGLWWLVPSGEGTMRAIQYLGPGLKDDDDVSLIRLDARPGVAVLVVRKEPSFHLFPGTRMTWTAIADE